MNLIWVDYLLIGLIVLSTVVSLFRGFVKEVVSLAGWVAAFWLALRYAQPLADAWLGGISLPSLRLGAAYLILFAGTLVLAELSGHLLALIVRHTRLQGTDRSLGMLFGALRGVVLTTILVMVCAATPLRLDPWWEGSLMIEKLTTLAQWSLDQLPADIAQQFRDLEAQLPELPALPAEE